MTRYKCPSCGSTNTTRITHEFSSYEEYEASQCGSLVPGGGPAPIAGPDRTCKDCKFQFVMNEKVGGKSR